MAQIQSYGPYGSQKPEKYFFQLAEGESVNEVHIKHGGVVDSIGFVVQKPDNTTYRKKFGGHGGKASVIELDDGEYLTRVSGNYGSFQGSTVINKIYIHTNLNPEGYGPYGLGDGSDVQSFTSPTEANGPVIGIFGRDNNYIESIGVYIKRG